MGELVIRWPAADNEHGEAMLWHGSWLVGTDGGEGIGFYKGRGGARYRYEIPVAATGLRIRRWPNEGLEPEYADLMELANVAELSADALDFDVRQPFSRLEEYGIS